MPESTHPKSKLNGQIQVINDDPATYTVECEEGNLSITGLTAAQREAIVVEDRGSFYTLIAGKQKYPTFTFSAYLRDLVDAGFATLVGILLRLGAYAASTGTLGATKPYTVDILWTIEGSDFGDSADHTLRLNDCRVEDVNPAEGDINTVSISGTCYGSVAFT